MGAATRAINARAVCVAASTQGRVDARLFRRPNARRVHGPRSSNETQTGGTRRSTIEGMKNMEKRKLGNTGFEVAPLALGGNVFGWTADEAMSFRLLDEIGRAH